MTNPFEALAENATRPMQAKLRRQAKQPMVPTPREKDQYDKSRQLRRFREWKREIRKGMTEGIYGIEIIMLLRLLRKTPDSLMLVDWVKGSKWLLDADEKVRLTVLGYIGEAMARWNVRHGLPPFNDSLPGEPDSPFIAVRKLLMGV